MAKKNTFSTVLISVIFALSVFAVISTTTKTDTIIAYINDGSVSWDNIEKIDIFCDGFYGRTMEEPLTVTDKKDIETKVPTFDFEQIEALSDFIICILEEGKL